MRILTTDEFSHLEIIGGSGNSNEDLWVRVADSDNQSDWESLTLTKNNPTTFEIADFLEIGNKYQAALDSLCDVSSLGSIGSNTEQASLALSSDILIASQDIEFQNSENIML